MRCWAHLRGEADAPGDTGSPWPVRLRWFPWPASEQPWQPLDPDDVCADALRRASRW